MRSPSGFQIAFASFAITGAAMLLPGHIAPPADAATMHLSAPADPVAFSDPARTSTTTAGSAAT